MTELPGDHIRPYEAPPPGMSSGSRLERALRAGQFAVTAELNPPDSADPADVFEAARPLAEVCDAINATDASGANCHMSSIGICALLTRAGYGTIYQISCRDRNRIAIQGDVLGAAAMGVRNVLCLTGDGIGVGDQPGAKPVFDFDSLTLLRTIRTMRDDGVFLSGRPITRPPHMFLGAAENPCVAALRAGAPSGWPRRSTPAPSSSRPTTSSTCRRFERFMARVRDLGLDRRVFILAGVGPLASAKAARWMRAQRARHPHPRRDHRPARAGARSPAEEGNALCIELMQRIREIPGVAGIHVMAYRREHQVSEIVLRSGVRGGRRHA